MSLRLTPKKRFDFAVQNVLNHEGGFSDNPNDPGGYTNHGISLRFLKEMDIDINHDDSIDVNDIKGIYFTDAIEIYKKYWWDKYLYDAIKSLALATKIFDMAVNMGPLQAHKIVQRACKQCGQPNIKVDGILSERTFFAINEISSTGHEPELMSAIVQNQRLFYQKLVDNYPQLKVFLKGWLNRAAYQGT